jgi:hypothetical protein
MIREKRQLIHILVPISAKNSYQVLAENTGRTLSQWLRDAAREYRAKQSGALVTIDPQLVTSVELRKPTTKREPEKRSRRK